MIKKIGITQRVHTIHEYQEHRDELDQNWSKLLNELGVLQIILPNNKQIIDNRIIDNYDLDGVILTGGELEVNDLGKNTGQIKRNDFELNLIKYCLDKSIPVIGICRGMQILNYFFGGSMKIVENHINVKHEIDNFSKFPISKKVNSYHEFIIIKEKLPSNFEIIATDSKGNIESIRDKKNKIFGIMWHPERNNPFDKNDIKLIKGIFNL